MTRADECELEKAKKELDEFLDAHPYMREYQNEIDRVLDSSTERLEVISMMLAGNLSDLHCQMQELLYSLNALSHDITLDEAA